jgi:BirA family transcriptional regulator, biotin operon repressor / biotin---[acetyl-CoA-carboxylase] ligase
LYASVWKLPPNFVSVQSSTEQFPRHTEACAVRMGSVRIELELAASTNATLWQAVSSAQAAGRRVPEGLLVRAHHQFAGRGQLGTSWHSAPGENLTISLWHQPRGLAAEHGFRLTKAISLAIASTCEAFLPGHPGPVEIKWPNDILIGGAKVAGVLLETQVVQGFIEGVVIGIGLNVNQFDFPPMPGRAPISLAGALGERISLEAVLAKLLLALERYLSEISYPSARARHDHDYRQRLFQYQTWAPYQIPKKTSDQVTDGGPLEGMIIGVNEDGRLALQTGTGISYYESKQVVFL